jgi:hypothetical protein
MKRFQATMWAVAIALLASVAAEAQSPTPPTVKSAAPVTSTQIPEPGDVALFLLGVTGLIVGRWSSRARKKRSQP